MILMTAKRTILWVLFFLMTNVTYGFLCPRFMLMGTCLMGCHEQVAMNSVAVQKFEKVKSCCCTSDSQGSQVFTAAVSFHEKELGIGFAGSRRMVPVWLLVASTVYNGADPAGFASPPLYILKASFLI